MQFVKYRWETSGLSGEPFLSVRKDNTVGKVRLLDQDVSMKIFEKTCIGYTKKTRHHPCPQNRQVDDERMCRECMLNDDFFMCVKCDGSECINDPQRNSCAKSKYYVYLAAFSDVLKVGISQEHRVLERLIEQGADMGAKIALIQDGKLVREIEQKIRSELGIKDRLRGIEKQKLLFGNPNTSAINIFTAFAKLRKNFGEYLIGPEIYNLQSIYRINSLSEHPKPFSLDYGSSIEGRIVAAKGNILVMRNSEGLHSFDANKMIGFRTEMVSA
ncbi:MAG TPA: DUF2797 domain-containing protein [archaeon]|nr:DUF2797 domain-containing protein [archaeon]